MVTFLEKLKKGMGDADISMPEKNSDEPEEETEEEENEPEETEKEEQEEIKPTEKEESKSKKKAEKPKIPPKIMEGKKPNQKTMAKQKQKKEIPIEISEENPEKSELDDSKTINFKKTKIESPKPVKVSKAKSWLGSEGQLTVDVYETDKNIVVRSAVAGVKPEDLDISVENDVLIIKGEREEAKGGEEENVNNYYHQECYWGKFSREIVLPEEVDFSKIEATMKDGILIVRIPKVGADKKKIKINE